MVLVGLAAAGRAGNASAAALGRLVTLVDDGVRDGKGEGRALEAADEEEAHGVCPGFAPMRFADFAGGRAGKGLLDDG
jgi:hypothetical protein